MSLTKKYLCGTGHLILIEEVLLAYSYIKDSNEVLLYLNRELYKLHSSRGIRFNIWDCRSSQGRRIPVRISLYLPFKTFTILESQWKLNRAALSFREWVCLPSPLVIHDLFIITALVMWRPQIKIYFATLYAFCFAGVPVPLGINLIATSLEITYFWVRK